MTTQVVTPAQVLAAKLAVELQREDGETPDDALVAIAEAQPTADLDPDGLGSIPDDAKDRTYVEMVQVIRNAIARGAQPGLIIRRPDGSMEVEVLAVDEMGADMPQGGLASQD